MLITEEETKYIKVGEPITLHKPKQGLTVFLRDEREKRLLGILKDDYLEIETDKLKLDDDCQIKKVVKIVLPVKINFDAIY